MLEKLMRSSPRSESKKRVTRENHTDSIVIYSSLTFTYFRVGYLEGNDRWIALPPWNFRFFMFVFITYWLHIIYKIIVIFIFIFHKKLKTE